MKLSNGIIVRGNDRSERCETGGAFRTYQFTLGTSLAVLTPIEQSEKKRLPSFRVQREKRNVSNQYYEEFTTSSIRDASHSFIEY